MRHSLRDSLAGIGRWPRLIAALACLLLAAVSALDATDGIPAPQGRRQPTTPVVVAARDLPVGHLVTRRDLTVRHWPVTIRPPGATAHPSQRVGHRLAGPLRSGEAVTTTRLVGPSLTDGLARGVAALPVGVAGASAADLVRPGDRVELLATSGDDAGSDLGDDAGDDPGDVDTAAGGSAGKARVTVVAPRLLVLAVLPGNGLSGAGDTLDGTTSLVVAADATTTRAITTLASTAVFTAVTISP